MLKAKVLNGRFKCKNVRRRTALIVIDIPVVIHHDVNGRKK
jgi:hypothetical protein